MPITQTLMNKLPTSTQIGHVSLTITNLARSVAYYQTLGLTLQNRVSNEAWLGAGETMLLHLMENQHAQIIERTTGLYHFAILLPSRLDLALAFRNMIDSQIPIGGYSDHLVSEAIYLSDPDGNGIEVYRDRPRDQWTFRDNGEMAIDTVPLDVHNLLGELENSSKEWQGFTAGTKLGHIHLHVSNLEAAGRFYTEQLGFDMIASYGRSAKFVSAGGYHHHIGMNTWAGVGVPAPPADAVGLRYYTIVLPHKTAVDNLKNHLTQQNIPFTQNEGRITLQDPSGNTIRLTLDT